jgi:hypothetical protein
MADVGWKSVVGDRGSQAFGGCSMVKQPKLSGRGLKDFEAAKGCGGAAGELDNWKTIEYWRSPLGQY